VQRERSTTVVAITGSNGKTSVKTLLLSILQRAGSAYANPGNRNNEIGLPLAVLDAPDDADFAVYEMGAGKPGDIAYLTAIARPDVALVNNIAPAHLERMGSLLGVAETKGAIYDALPADGVAVVNADDALRAVFRGRAHDRRVLRFGLDASADVTGTRHPLDADGSRFVLVAPQGEAAVCCRCRAATTCAMRWPPRRWRSRRRASAGRCASGLEAVQPVAGPPGRARAAQRRGAGRRQLQRQPGLAGAAIDTLAAAATRRWLVLGDMRELGPRPNRAARAGRARAKAAGIARLYALGPLSAAAVAAFGEARAFDSHAALADALAADLRRKAGRAGAGEGIARQRDGSHRQGAAAAHAAGRRGNDRCCLN
jgi:UDP-N-acetylmuramoyl-tripeptide--D-alanyl-D-alanine ligase